MKKFLALAVLATSTVSFAAERNIYDIMYLPNAGTSYGASLFSIATAKQEADGGDSDISGYNFFQTFGHAFTDRLSAQVALDYSSIEVDSEGEEKYDARQGFSDPTFSARYRVMEDALTWDIAGGAVLSLMDKETELDSEGHSESDNLQGGNSIFIGTQIGSKTESFQWALAAQVTHNFKAENEYELTTGQEVTLEDDANDELTLQADILNKLAEKSFLRSHFTADFTESFEDDQENTTPAFTTYDIGTEYQHLISQDLLLRAGIDYSIIKVQTGQIDSYTGWNYSFGANYQF